MPSNRKSQKGSSGHSSNCSQESVSDLDPNDNDNRRKTRSRNQASESSNSSPRTANICGTKSLENKSSPVKLTRKRSSTRNYKKDEDAPCASDAESFSSSQNNSETLSPQPCKRQKTNSKNSIESPRRKSSRLNKEKTESDHLNSSQESVDNSNHSNVVAIDNSRKRKYSESSESAYTNPIFQKTPVLKEFLCISLPDSKRLKQSSLNTNGAEPVFQEPNSSDDVTNNNIPKSELHPVSSLQNASESDNDWINWSDGCNLTDKDPVVERVWQSSNSSSSDSEKNHQFSLLSYNIFTDSYHANDKRNCVPISSKNSRHKLLLKEIKHIGADIICFQEVNQQYYDTTLRRDLHKTFSSLVERYAGNEHSSGLAMFFNQDKFKELHYEVIDLHAAVEPIISELSVPESVKSSIRNYLDVPRHMQILLLQNLSNKNVFLLANIHAGSRKNGNATLSIDINCTQICAALWKINNILSEHAFTKSRRNSNKLNQPIPWIFCGDFGASSHSPVYQICRDGYPSDESLSKLQQLKNIKIPGFSENQALINILWRAFQHPFTDLFSSYQYVLGREPPLTVNDQNFVGCNDFIWTNSHHNSLRPFAVLVPRCSYMKNLKDALPNDKFPSKHSSLACRFIVS